MALDLTYLKRWIDAMPPADQPELQILKAHLLAEESLNRYLAHNLPNPKALGPRMGFARSLSIAHAVTPHSAADWIWPALRALNALRNSLAHEISDPTRKQLTTEFIRCAETSPQWQSSPSGGQPPETTPIMQALFLVSNELHSRVSVSKNVADELRIPWEVDSSGGVS